MQKIKEKTKINLKFQLKLKLLFSCLLKMILFLKDKQTLDNTSNSNKQKILHSNHHRIRQNSNTLAIYQMIQT